MSRRSDELRSDLLEAERRIAGAVADAPASALVALHATADDDPSFIDKASRLATAASLTAGLSHVYAIHIDNWFGPRWLGFRGKTRGVAGIRNRTLKRSLGVPPFHPNRVLASRGHLRREDGLYADVEAASSIHIRVPSEFNIQRDIRRDFLYAWYSGDSAATRRGVVMIYFQRGADCKAFYVAFDGDRDWEIDQHVGITRREVRALLDGEIPNRATESVAAGGPFLPGWF